MPQSQKPLSRVEVTADITETITIKPAEGSVAVHQKIESDQQWNDTEDRS